MPGLGWVRFARRYSGHRGFFLFLRVLRCFSSPGCLRTAYGFSSGCSPIRESGLPHSDIPGSMPAYGSPRHFGVRSVLRRLLAPRHPPCALRSLIISYGIHILREPGECFLSSFQGTNGGAERNRTADLLLARQALSQLSYSPVAIFIEGVQGDGGPKWI